MGALGLWGLDRGGMWRDEAVTFQVARRTVPQIWRLLHGVDAVHGLYYLLMHAVLAVHPGEVVLRLPSVGAAAVTAALVAALGTRLLRPRAGLVAGLLYAITPMAGHYAQEGRSYALVAAGATAATLLFVRAVQDGGRWRAYGVVLGLTCWLHEFAVLVLLAHAVSLALARPGARVWRGWGCAAAAVSVALLPMVLVSHAQSAQLAWLRQPTPATARNVLRAFLGGPAPAVYWTCLTLAVLGLAGLVGLRSGLTCARVALPLAVVPPATLMLVSRLAPLYVDRYVLYALSGAPLLVAAGAERVDGGVRRLWSAYSRKSCSSQALKFTRPREAATVPPQAWEFTRSEEAAAAPPQAEFTRPGEGAAVPPQALGFTRPREGDDVPPQALEFTRPGEVAAVLPPGSEFTRSGGAAAAPRTGLRDGGVPSPPGGPRPLRRGRLRLARAGASALAVALGLGLALSCQLPVLRADRDPGRRPDDLGAVARVAAREVGPGEAVLFLPVRMRNAALAYPGAFRGVRDVALAEPGDRSGTLYGREAGAGVLRRRVAGLGRVWVVGDQALLDGRRRPSDPAERAELDALAQAFVPGAQSTRGGATVRLYVRRARLSRSSAPRAVPPRPGRR
ncbi:glycosyltransferase family 39 protein [Streptomyces bungoensis]|uniref:glycosyltransferase family 39 protein n=1 Tax=Streptomyces bungoensis TaxID=285568 RepID=UPI001FC99D41|nr:glycosyltransferase family 39 protein [Streptomyces bungoensis]